MANTLAFKCYLSTNNGQDKEIRRFALESDVVTNFAYLKEKVRSVYPQLLRESFTLLYVDDEGDKVTISSDDELVAALLFVKRKDDEPFRLLVQACGLKSEPTSFAASTGSCQGVPTGNCQGEIHFGVTCDGCQGIVRGFRYKCFQCPDFDLCGKCETAGLHPGHQLIRITGAVPASFQAMRNLLSGGPEVPYWRRKHHGRHHHQQNHHGWNAWCPSGINVEIDPQSSGECKKEAEKPEAKKQCPYKFYMDQAKQTASTFQASHPEFLLDLSNTVASFLEGLGINTSTSCPRSTAQTERKTNDSTGETKNASDKPKETKQEIIIPITVEKRESSPEPQKKADEVGPYAQLFSDAVSVDQEVNAANAGVPELNPNLSAAQFLLAAQVAEVAAQSAAKAAAHEAEQAAKAAEELNKQTSQSPNETTSKSPSPLGDTGEWTIINNAERPVSEDQASSQLGARPKSPPQQPVQQPAAEPEVLHPDPLIAAALETMLAMGFTNEGGWLAQLLEVKGGDIGKALDVLHSRFQRRQ